MEARQVKAKVAVVEGHMCRPPTFSPTMIQGMTSLQTEHSPPNNGLDQYSSRLMGYDGLGMASD